MKRWKLVFGLMVAGIVLACTPALAQTCNTTVVSGTIADPQGFAYSNATITFILAPAVSSPICGGSVIFTQGPPQAFADAKGHFTLTLPQTSAITPGGETYTVQVNGPGAAQPPIGTGPQFFQITGVTLTTVTLDLSASLNAVAPSLTTLSGGVSNTFASLTAGTNSNAGTFGFAGNTFSLASVGTFIAPSGYAGFCQLAGAVSGDYCGFAGGVLEELTPGFVPNEQTSTYTLASTDRGSNVYYTGSSGSSVAWTIPDAGSAGFTGNWFARVCNAGTGGGSVVLSRQTASHIFQGGTSGTSVTIAPGLCFDMNTRANGTDWNAETFGSGATVSGTANTVAKFTGTNAVGNSSISDDGTNPAYDSNGFDVAGTGRYQWQLPNNAATGTTLNKLACNDGSNKAIICSHTTSTTNDPLGVAVNGFNGAAPGTTGNTAICNIGFCTITFDNAATSGHYAQESSSVDGDLSDVGATVPTNGQATYYINASNSGAGTNGVVRILTQGDMILAAQSAGGNGNSTNIQVNGSATKKIANFATSSPGSTVSSSNSGNTSTINITPNAITPSGTVASGDVAAWTATGSGTQSLADGGPAGGAASSTPPAGVTPVGTATAYTIQKSDDRHLVTGAPTSAATYTLPQPSSGTAPFVSSTNTATTLNGSVTTATATLSLTASNFMAVWGVVRSNTPASPPTPSFVVTDNQSDTVVTVQAPAAGHSITNGSATIFPFLYYVQTVVGGSTTVTVTCSNCTSITSGEIDISLGQYTTITGVDGVVSYNSGANSTFVTNSVVTNFKDDLIITGSAGTDSGQAIAGFTQRATMALNGNGLFFDQLISAPNTVNYSSLQPVSSSFGWANLGLALRTSSTLSFMNGFSFTVRDSGTAAIALTPTSATVTTQFASGAASASVLPGYDAFCMSDGGNYQCILFTSPLASGTAAMTTGAITSGTCGATVTVAATGTVTSDVIAISESAAPTSPNGLLRLEKWPTSGNVNFAWCNPTASSQTPAAETINWRVIR